MSIQMTCRIMTGSYSYRFVASPLLDPDRVYPRQRNYSRVRQIAARSKRRRVPMPRHSRRPAVPGRVRVPPAAVLPEPAVAALPEGAVGLARLVPAAVLPEPEEAVLPEGLARLVRVPGPGR